MGEEENTEQREAADTAIKRSLIAGSLMVLFLAALFSYIVLSTLWSQSRPEPATEKEDDSTPPVHYNSYQLARPTPSNSPPTDVASPTKDSSESSERTEHSSTDESGNASTEKEVTVLNN